MTELEKLANQFLKSEGFQELEHKNGCIIAQRIDFGGTDVRIVQTVPAPRVPNHRHLERVVDIRSNYPDARATMLVQSRDGISRDYMTDLSIENVRLVVPVQFFDAPFKVETAPKTTSVINEIRAQAEKEVRIPQPFELDGTDENGKDLLNTLLREIMDDEGPRIRFVVGQAGIGKSYLFRALFNRLYSDFVHAKRSQKLHARPIPLLPEHLKGASTTRIDQLIRRFLHDDIASPIQPDTFSWLLTNGFATWLLDGLDELYAGDATFFDDVFNLLGEIDSKAQIIIWCRDSLLTSSTAFAEFLDCCSDLNVVKVFKLTGWTRQQKRLFAWQRTKERKPKPHEDDPIEVKTFLTTVASNPTLESLSAIPFYCGLIFERIRESRILSIRDDVELLNSVIDDIVLREKEKGLLNEADFEENGLEDWMEEIAVEYVNGKGYADTAQAREFGELVLLSDLSDDRREDNLRSLLQFPLFSSSDEGTGRIAFAHELIAQALAARFYLKEINRERERTTVFDRLTSIDFDHPVLLRFIASRCTPEMTEYLLNQLRGGGISNAAFGAVLFLILLVRPARDLVLQENLQFAGKNLAGIRFKNRKLAGQSFFECNLHRVSFENCDLRNASFEGALLNRTYFIDCDLANAHFPNPNRIDSISFGGKEIHENKEIRKKISDETGMTMEISTEPCPTALQVVQIFTKFVNRLGESRRRHFYRRVLLAGKRIEGAATKDSCVRELVRSGYLVVGTDDKQRYFRCEGDAYREVVVAVKDGTLSESLGSIVSKLCRREDCSHQVC